MPNHAKVLCTSAKDKNRWKKSPTLNVDDYIILWSVHKMLISNSMRASMQCKSIKLLCNHTKQKQTICIFFIWTTIFLLNLDNFAVNSFHSITICVSLENGNVIFKIQFVHIAEIPNFNVNSKAYFQTTPTCVVWIFEKYRRCIQHCQIETMKMIHKSDANRSNKQIVFF